MCTHQPRYFTISSIFPAKLMPRCLASEDSRLDAEAGITGLLLALTIRLYAQYRTLNLDEIVLLARKGER